MTTKIFTRYGDKAKYRVSNCFVIENRIYFDYNISKLKKENKFNFSNFELTYQSFEFKYVKRPFVNRVWELKEAIEAKEKKKAKRKNKNG